MTEHKTYEPPAPSLPANQVSEKGRNNSRSEKPAVTVQHEAAFSGSAETLSEVAQAKIRNWMHIAILALAIIAVKFDAPIAVSDIVLTTLVTVPASFALYFWALSLRKSKRMRMRIALRATTIVYDNALITWVLYFGGITAAGVFALYIWISVGYGIRFGLNYLYATLSLSVVMFCVGAWFTPFWRENPGLVAGMLFGLVLVPAYTGWLIAQLQKAVAEKDLAYRAKSDFVAMMSHELRTPLHGIISTSDLLRGTANSPKQKEMIRIISTSSNTLLELINRVLDISKFESKSVALQQVPMDLHAIVNDTANILWPQALSKGLALQVYIDPEIQNSLLGSPHQLQEVLINLLGNAVKFTESGNVSIRVLYKAETSDSVAISFEISDTGPGIPKKALENIFEPFAQSNSPLTRKHGGTGLGTTFAKELIRLMGGNIFVESTEGVGTKFTIDVDLAKLEEREGVSPLFPFTIVAVGFADDYQPLSNTLAQFGTRVVNTEVDGDSLALEASATDEFPDAIFVNADAHAENLRRVVFLASNTIPDRITPVFACGSEEYRASAIAAGYSAYIPDATDSQLVGRALNMISALRHDASPDSQKDRSARNALRILVAEDNQTNQRIAQLVLEEAGHFCTIVGNGDEALDALHDGGFDIAILDMHMPNRDGMEVAKIYNFSHFDEESRIPLIMMTADSRTEAREEAKASGIDAFVTKPISPNQLLDVIDSIADRFDIVGLASLSSDALLGNTLQTIDDALKSTGRSTDKILDMATIEELVSFMVGDERNSFFDDFFSDGARYIDSLLDARDSDRAKVCVGNMHAFAGACLVVGANALADEARNVEFADLENVVADRLVLHNNIKKTFALTRKEIESHYLT